MCSNDQSFQKNIQFILFSYRYVYIYIIYFKRSSHLLKWNLVFNNVLRHRLRHADSIPFFNKLPLANLIGR